MRHRRQTEAAESEVHHLVIGRMQDNLVGAGVARGKCGPGLMAPQSINYSFYADWAYACADMPLHGALVVGEDAYARNFLDAERR